MPAGHVFGVEVRDGFFALLRQGVSVSEACRVSGLWSSTVAHWVRKMGPVEMPGVIVVGRWGRRFQIAFLVRAG